MRPFVVTGLATGLAAALALPARAATRHPVVLMHGFMGNGATGPLGYWSDIPDVLAARGTAATVLATSPADSPFARARLVEKALLAAADASPTGRVNVIAHSMGGLDARVLATHLAHADRIASITTLATPHRGSPIADVAMRLLDGGCARALLPTADAVIGALFAAPDPQHLLAGVRALQPATAERFNETVPDDPRTTYLSVVAKTTFSLTRAIDGADLVDAPLLPTYAVMADLGLENDGLVPVGSQRWGEVLGEVNADHQNLVGQPLGLTGLQFDHRHFFAWVASKLEERGL